MKGPKLKDVEAACRAIYQSTRSFIKGIAPRIGAANLGFKMLYGPPVVEPPILFIGYQPGGEKESMIESEHQGWPEACEYDGTYQKLNRQLRQQIERFCRDQVEDLVADLRPQRIVFIGFKTMGLFVDQGADDLVSDKGVS